MMIDKKLFISIISILSILLIVSLSISIFLLVTRQSFLPDKVETSRISGIEIHFSGFTEAKTVILDDIKIKKIVAAVDATSVVKYRGKKDFAGVIKYLVITYEFSEIQFKIGLFNNLIEIDDMWYRSNGYLRDIVGEVIAETTNIK